MSTTLVSQSFEQERIIRDSPSAGAWVVERHIIPACTTGSVIETKLDKIYFCSFGGFDGATLPSSLTITPMPAQTLNSMGEGIRQVVVVGGSGFVCVEVIGKTEGQ